MIDLKWDDPVFRGIAAVSAVVYLGFLVFALILLVSDGHWIFAISDGTLRVESPAKLVGATFSVRIADIVSITQVPGIEGSSSSLYVITQDGKKHEITQNSGLDIYRLFAKLEELNPSIRKEYSTVSDVLGRSLPGRLLKWLGFRGAKGTL